MPHVYTTKLGATAAAALADGSDNPTVARVEADNALFNETTWDRQRGNVEITLLASAARTATANTADQTNYNHRGAVFTLDVTVVSGTTPTLDVKIQALDTLSGKYADIPGAAFAQKTAANTSQLVVYPGVAETANVSVSDVLPRKFRAVCTIAGSTPSFTFSLGAALVL